MNHFVKNAGVWKETQTLSIRSAGIWKEVQDGYIKDGGLWKPFHSTFSTKVNDVEFLLEDGADDDGSIVFSLDGHSVANDDTLVVVYALEWDGGVTSPTVTGATLDGVTCTEDAHASGGGEAEGLIWRVPATNVSKTGSIALQVSATADPSVSASRSVIAVYRIPGGVVDGLVSVNTEYTLNGGQHSLDVDFTAGVLVGGHYTGEDTGEHTWSGVDSYINLTIPNNAGVFAQASAGHGNNRGDANHTVSFSHTDQDNGQGVSSMIAVYN